MMTSTTEQRTDRLAALRHRLIGIRRNALDMGEVQGQGYIGQALGVADILAVVYMDQLRTAPKTRIGGGTGSCCRSGTTPSPCTRHWPRRGSSQSPRCDGSMAETAPCPDGVLHTRPRPPADPSDMSSPAMLGLATESLAR